MAGLLDALFQGGTYGGQNRGLLDLLSQSLQQRQDYQPSPGFAPTQASPIQIGNYQMPRVSPPDAYQPDQAALPQASAPTQGQGVPQAQPQQAMQLPPAFGGGGLGQYLQRLHNGGGLITSAMDSPEQQNMRAEFLATRDALAGNGMSPEQATRLAMVAVMNKQAGQAILPEMLGTPKEFKPIKNDFGGEIPGSYNKRTGEWTPINVGGASGPSGSMQDIVDKIGTLQSQGADRSQLLAQIPPGYRDDVQALVEGRGVPQNMGRAQARATLLTLAHAIDRNFDETRIPTKIQMRKDFAGEGKNGQSIGAFNTVQHHIDQVSDAAEEYFKAGGGSNYPSFNALKMGLASNTGWDPKLRDAAQKLTDKMNAAEHEVNSAYNAGHITDADRRTWETIKASNLPANQLRQRLADFVDLLQGKRESLNHMYRTEFGEDAPTIDRQANEATAKKVHSRLDTGQSSYIGAQPQFQEGMTATNPQTGQKITFKNGKWQ